MATEADSLDFDIYGDGQEYYQQDEPEAEFKTEIPFNPTTGPQEEAVQPINSTISNSQFSTADVKLEAGHESNDVAQKIASSDESAPDRVHLPKYPPQMQGLKRKYGADNRVVDPGATSALSVSELHWWVNDDDIRGWANQSQCEDELKEVTFSEHKVNGKSKG